MILTWESINKKPYNLEKKIPLVDVENLGEQGVHIFKTAKSQNDSQTNPKKE